MCEIGDKTDTGLINAAERLKKQKLLQCWVSQLSQPFLERVDWKIISSPEEQDILCPGSSKKKMQVLTFIPPNWKEFTDKVLQGQKILCSAVELFYAGTQVVADWVIFEGEPHTQEYLMIFSYCSYFNMH